jgi:hypothetical protein
MALVKNQEAASGKSFEMEDSDVGGDTATETTHTMTADEKVAAQVAKNASRAAGSAGTATGTPADAAQQTSTSTAVAASKPNDLVISMTKANPFTPLENAIHVDYNTLTRIMVTNGNVQNKETKALYGDSVELQLISFQKHHVVAPGGDSKDEESLNYLKFSDDGKTERETGRPLQEFVDAAIAAGYDQARIQERVILVGELVKAAKACDIIGELVQIDLAPRSVRNFNTYQVNSAFKVAKGLLTAEQARRVKIVCDVQTKGSNNWTDAKFEVGTGA